jgi:hypothetical protein
MQDAPPSGILHSYLFRWHDIDLCQRGSQNGRQTGIQVLTILRLFFAERRSIPPWLTCWDETCWTRRRPSSTLTVFSQTWQSHSYWIVFQQIRNLLIILFWLAYLRGGLDIVSSRAQLLIDFEGLQSKTDSPTFGSACREGPRSTEANMGVLGDLALQLATASCPNWTPIYNPMIAGSARKYVLSDMYMNSRGVLSPAMGMTPCTLKQGSNITQG